MGKENPKTKQDKNDVIAFRKLILEKDKQIDEKYFDLDIDDIVNNTPKNQQHDNEMNEFLDSINLESNADFLNYKKKYVRLMKKSASKDQLKSLNKKLKEIDFKDKYIGLLLYWEQNFNEDDDIDQAIEDQVGLDSLKLLAD